MHLLKLKHDKTKCWSGYRTTGTLIHCCEGVNWYTHLGDNSVLPNQVEDSSHCGPVIPLLGMTQGQSLCMCTRPHTWLLPHQKRMDK